MPKFRRKKERKEAFINIIQYADRETLEVFFSNTTMVIVVEILVCQLKMCEMLKIKKKTVSDSINITVIADSYSQ